MATKIEIEIDYNIGDFVTVKGANNVKIMGSVIGYNIQYNVSTVEGVSNVEQLDVYSVFVGEGHPYNGMYLTTELNKV